MRKPINTGNLNKLFDGTNESFYWLGFLLADGHFSKQNRLQLDISLQDEIHLKKFGTFIEFSGKIYYKDNRVILGINNKEFIKNSQERFGICNNKTYNPPDIKYFENLSDDQIFSLIIGFIDGDGSITCYERKTCSLNIVGHKSWRNLMNFFVFRLSKIVSVSIKLPILDKRGFLKLQVRSHPLNKKLKTKIIELNLPILNRKWNKIDLNYQTVNEINEILFPKLKILIDLNTPQKEICKLLNIPRHKISHFKKINGYYQK